MNRPDVTVMMPVFNRANLIARAIESVRAQTLPSWELLIIDDGSVDATAEVAQRYAATDPRIKFARNDGHSGISRTRNEL
jgi:glycosyltransferase involved in cell wall biosynthesis